MSDNHLRTTGDEPRPDEAAGEDRLCQAVLAVVQARERGDQLGVEQILERHPDLREQLCELLELESFFGLDRRPRRPPEQAPDDALTEKYELLGEVGSGGYGRVFKARDRALGRLVAIKVFKPDLADLSAFTRFLEEPQVASQLDHPGVPPVHEMAKTADGRPYVVMKWVDGQTLAKLLRTNRSASDLPRFLEVFRQICQTLAYAHRRRGVLHRDLKPENIMVGAFGEVFVMDWGLSKVVLAPPDGAGAGERVPVETLRTRHPNMVTRDGAHIGTWAYMSPEQAGGQIAGITARSDVFGLGTILCEILTGHPPYWDPGLEKVIDPVEQAGLPTQSDGAYERAMVEVVRRAKAGDLTAADARIHASGADPALIRLAKACLAPRSQDRPADAGEVADAVTDYLEGLQAKVREHEVEEATLRARLSALRPRVVAGIVLVLALAGAAGGAAWYSAERQQQKADASRRDAERTADIQHGLDQFEAALRGREFPAGWAILARVEARLEKEGPDEFRARMRAGKRDLAFVEQREDLRQQRFHSIISGPQPDLADVSNDYARAFRDYGIDPSDPDTAARTIRESPIRTDLLAALDHWAVLAPSVLGMRRKLLRTAQAATTTEWGRQFRDPDLRRDRDGLVRLAEETRPEQCSPEEIESLAWALLLSGCDAESVLRRGLTLHGGDFWLNLLLLIVEGRSRTNPSAEGRRQAYEEAVGYVRAALLLRRQGVFAHELLGLLLTECGRFDEAARELRQAIQEQPAEVLRAHVVRTRYALARTLMLKGDLDEAENACGEALAITPHWEPLINLMKQIRKRRLRP